jgi:arsenate reductase
VTSTTSSPSSPRRWSTFTGTLDAQTVNCYVGDSYVAPHRTAYPDQQFPELAQRFATDRLTALAHEVIGWVACSQVSSRPAYAGVVERRSPPSPDQQGEALVSDKPSVLFVCVHNAGRSQMAAGWLRHLAGDTVEVRSAGSEPGEHINPSAVEAMAEVGIDITDQAPKKLEWETAESSDVIITMGCGDACPIFPGKRYDDWKLEDPAGKGVEAVRPIRDEIKARIEKLLIDLVPAG